MRRTEGVLFWLLGRIVGNRGKWLKRLGLTDLSASLGRRVARTVVAGIGILIALEILDAAVVVALLGVAGVAGIALGFAFRNIVENDLAGLRGPSASGFVDEPNLLSRTGIHTGTETTFLEHTTSSYPQAGPTAGP